ncbi:lycopene cyclase [Mycobacterium kubicae]|uniref:Lycopene cyclase n=1 Tax=Mycobacterium kubicae TaxID=120959 RepID=A0AAX1JD48_9MYCO|nr:lycopene cyclase domain-containing protein [Mycobacterium kubicae]MCV7098424.1 lycopene cyclase domain-containing protein [Mycobacterium kubicae]ORW02147.1 lycopene cyclase [Mycobacterium kubicae]QNI11260.1 lycopene cyclase domain-containing protein [Mycobacterium kubicae]QPI39474.1 lycopene cyclase domain-containing protein [Mycobacterium kubicae]GFG64069.1 lycopene cyclase [Mycobacterium kubicae]
MTDRWQYLLVLAACLAITAPLEIFRPGVYRQWRRLLRAVVPVAVVFLIWDEIAVAANVWKYDSTYLTGLTIPFRVPIEEVLFFLVIPVCGLLTYNAVNAILDRVNRR